MLNLDPAKLLVIGLIAMVVLGPERLPKVARQLGGAWRELTRLRDQVTNEVKSAFPVDDLPKMPNVSASITSAVSSFSRPLSTSTSVAGSGIETDGGATTDPTRREMPPIRRAPTVVVHPELGDFAFLPDDPSQN